MPLNVELAEIRDFLSSHAPFDSLPAAVLESVPPRLSICYHRRDTVVLLGGGVLATTAATQLFRPLPSD